MKHRLAQLDRVGSGSPRTDRSRSFERDASGAAGSLASRTERDRKFTSLYLREAGFVVRALLRFGVPRQDVEDAAQEVFLITHRRFEELEMDQSFKAWLSAVARRVGQNHQRGLRRKQRTLGAAPESDFENIPAAVSLQPDRLAELDEQYRTLVNAIQRLDKKKRETIILAEIQELSAIAIGDRLDTPVSTIQSRLRAARRQLRFRLARKIAPSAR